MIGILFDVVGAAIEAAPLIAEITIETGLNLLE